MKLKLALILSVLSLNVGCVQMPTTSSSTVDNRPQIVFKVSDTSDVEGMRVIVDGLDNGPVAPFTNGTQALRILPGTHIIKILNGDTVISSQKIYVSDGVIKEVLIK
ncbi:MULTISPECIES: hypothetical protein [Shewanella]|uniref:hypothetical protein n=1 Tax=Shewanella TaxID=22 RepID=UPI00057B5AAE|nr:MULTISPECIES: hypothetical protein [Shewanella]